MIREKSMPLYEELLEVKTMAIIELLATLFLISCCFTGVKRTWGLGHDLLNKLFDWAEGKLKK